MSDINLTFFDMVTVLWIWGCASLSCDQTCLLKYLSAVCVTFCRQTEWRVSWNCFHCVSIVLQPTGQPTRISSLASVIVFSLCVCRATVWPCLVHLMVCVRGVQCALVIIIVSIFVTLSLVMFSVPLCFMGPWYFPCACMFIVYSVLSCSEYTHMYRVAQNSEPCLPNLSDSLYLCACVCDRKKRCSFGRTQYVTTKYCFLS